MRYVDEFRSPERLGLMAQRIRQVCPDRPVNIMEVCGTHTRNFRRFGLHRLIPPNIRLIAGPGCPVCVSPTGYLAGALQYARDRRVIIATFGDMLDVPSGGTSLSRERAEGACVYPVYSPLEALSVAEKNPARKVVFLAVGFETTAAAIALTLLAGRRQRLKNLFFYSSLKLIPPAMTFLLARGKADISGFLCPGHVSAVIGTKSYAEIPERYKIACCVAGFEPFDMLQGLYLLLRQIREERPRVQNQYVRLVTARGNLKAQRLIREVFETCDSQWRGLGTIAHSGLRIKSKFNEFDAEKAMPLKRAYLCEEPRQSGCQCSDVLKGLLPPASCPLFGKRCSPQHPQGPCMVSQEGACNAYYTFH